MEDDPDNKSDELRELEAIFASGEAQAGRVARIRELSDTTLSHYYSLLSNPRYVTNVSVLPLFEDELRRRGLPLGNSH